MAAVTAPEHDLPELVLQPSTEIDMKQQPSKGTAGDRTPGQTRTTHDQSASPAGGDGSRGVKPQVEPALPHEIDESSRSQASANEQHAAVGKKALEDASGPSQDTDRGPVLDKVYHEHVAPDQGHVPPRR